MPNSCRDIINKMVYKGAMTMDERNKLLRNLRSAHGRWTLYEVYGITIAECSECKRTMPTPINKYGATPFRYCPYCGSDNRETNDEHD